MKFKENNIRCFNNFNSLDGIPAEVEFTVNVVKDDPFFDYIELIADGYGNKENFGSGHILLEYSEVIIEQLKALGCNIE